MIETIANTRIRKYCFIHSFISIFVLLNCETFVYGISVDMLKSYSREDPFY